MGLEADRVRRRLLEEKDGKQKELIDILEKRDDKHLEDYIRFIDDVRSTLLMYNNDNLKLGIELQEKLIRIKRAILNEKNKREKSSLVVQKEKLEHIMQELHIEKILESL